MLTANYLFKRIRVREIQAGLILVIFLLISTPLAAATGSSTSTKKVVTKPVQSNQAMAAALTTSVREVVGSRLLECSVTKYSLEPAKKLVQIRVVAVPNKYWPQLSAKGYEKEAGQIFKKLFTSKFPIGRAELKFFLPPAHKEMVYFIILTDKMAKTVDWNQIDNIEFSSVAVYVWPLPMDACSGYGDL